MTLDTEVFITPKQLCERWGNVKTTDALGMDRKRGVGPRFVRLSERRVVYRLSDVRSFERANTFHQDDDSADQ